MENLGLIVNQLEKILQEGIQLLIVDDLTWLRRMDAKLAGQSYPRQFAASVYCNASWSRT